MQTNVLTPMQIFNLPQHLLVPLFQRPYVWDEQEQWEPLWQDVRRLAEVRLREPFSSASHFLGAVVLQAQEGHQGHMPASNIIDGQQRLTTLQLLMDAAGAVLEESGADALAGQLESLTHNQENFLRAGETALKVRHTNRDRDAFDEVMCAEPPIDHAGLVHAATLIARAHAFFSRSVSSWLGSQDDEGFGARAGALVVVLTSGLQLVAINLSATENSQEIFETLNARGTPLTAADLVKNFVFQRLAAEGADARRAYAEDWPFDAKFWESEVSVGRYRLSRSSLFLNQWLVSRTGEEIGPHQTFTRFKSFVEHDSGEKLSALLPAIKAQADDYERWTVAAADPDRQLGVVEMAVYRMRVNETEVLTPLLLWLHAPGLKVPLAVIEAAVAVAESWVVRRQLLRLTSADLGRIVAELIQAHQGVPAPDLVERITGHLSRLNASSTYWPGDEEVRLALTSEAVYRRFKRGRLRVLLEAVEYDFRRETNSPQLPRRGYPIEHVLPQQWKDTWPVDGLEAELARSARVHRLGNLTLLTTSLNSKVSNGGWPVKRTGLREHDTLLLNSRLLSKLGEEPWEEGSIDARTAELISAFLRIWPVPGGHTGQVVDPQDRGAHWVELKHLVAEGVLAPGTVLSPRDGRWSRRPAVVRADGLLVIEERTFDTPSGAGKFVKGSVTNGWYFWRLPDGRKLVDLRAEFTTAKARQRTAADET
ncbi:MAG: GmrSD restriction endonuclease domain-containing protein [Sporichthyaceae bacterium]